MINPLQVRAILRQFGWLNMLIFGMLYSSVSVAQSKPDTTSYIQTPDIKDLTPVFYGGQGTINMPSWSPDSQKIAFVSYSVR